MNILKTSVRLVRGQAKVIFGVATGMLVGGSASAVVLAAIPDNTGVIHACYKTSGGQTRIVDNSSQSCNSNESAVSWNSAAPGQFVTNLAGADFSNTDLRYRNLAGSNLSGANFHRRQAYGGQS